MRVLWITTDALEPVFSQLTGNPTKGSPWIAPLFFNLTKDNKFIFGVITPILNGIEQKILVDNSYFYSVKIKKGQNKKSIDNSLMSQYRRAIEDFQPDIIHIHGIENNYAQIRKEIDSEIPIVCSIQGIITACIPNLKQSIVNTDIDKFKSIKNRLGYGGINSMIKKWANYSSLEKEIINLNRYFIGRTLWDKAQLLSMNSKAEYFHGEELLRPEFYNKNWSLNTCKKYRIFASSAANPIKGFHVLLKAVALLKQKYPEVELVVPLSLLDMETPKWKDFLIKEDYGRYIKNEIIRLNLINNVLMQKRLSAKEMADSYFHAHVFVLPSFIENSPNSLGEAMLIGTPVIASPVGGVQSIIKDEESGLLFPTGDEAVLAYQIDRIFTNDNLAKKLSNNAKEIALNRHCISKTTNEYKCIYNNVIEIHKNQSDI